MRKYPPLWRAAMAGLGGRLAAHGWMIGAPVRVPGRPGWFPVFSGDSPQSQQMSWDFFLPGCPALPKGAPASPAGCRLPGPGPVMALRLAG